MVGYVEQKIVNFTIYFVHIKIKSNPIRCGGKEIKVDFSVIFLFSKIKENKCGRSVNQGIKYLSPKETRISWHWLSQFEARVLSLIFPDENTGILIQIVGKGKLAILHRLLLMNDWHPITHCQWWRHWCWDYLSFLSYLLSVIVQFAIYKYHRWRGFPESGLRVILGVY